LHVYDSQGKQLYTEDIITNTTVYIRILDFSLKDDGIYYYRLQAGEQFANGKIVCKFN